MGRGLMVVAPPKFQLGYVSPLPVVDALHYEFYQAIRQGVVMISAPVPLSDFTTDKVEEGLRRMTEAFRYLAKRRAGRIVVGGMPPSALAGRGRMLDLMAAAGDELGVAITSDVEDVLACLRRLDITDIAVAAKWKPEVMVAVESYFTEAGMNVVGIQGSDYGAEKIKEVVTTESVQFACDLGEAALGAFPAASALVLGGGTWLSIPASRALECTFDKPVVSNMTAMFEETARFFGVRAQGVSDLRLAQAESKVSEPGYAADGAR